MPYPVTRQPALALPSDTMAPTHLAAGHHAPPLALSLELPPAPPPEPPAAPAETPTPRFDEAAARHRVRRAIASLADQDGIALSAAKQARPLASATAATNDASEFALIDAALCDWVDFDKAKHYATSPSRLLQAVADHQRRTIPFDFETWPDVALLEDEGVLDAAAVLHRRLIGDTAANEAQPEAPEQTLSTVLSELRPAFLATLREDYAKEAALDALFAPSGERGQTAPYFDGFALRNVRGRSFEDLLTSPDVWRDSRLASADPQRRRALLEAKFEQMSESTVYPFGTPEHSLATTLMRIQSYRGLTPTQPRNSEALIATFQQVEQSWADEGGYPYHPHLAFAAHLARTDGIQLLGPEDVMLIFQNRVADPARAALAQGNALPLEWITAHLAKFQADGKTWHAQSPEVSTRAIESLFDALRDAAKGNEPISEFARSLRDQGALIENRIVGTSRAARMDALFAYANERLIARFGEPPRFDRYDAATAILRGYGLSDDDLENERAYVIGGDNPNLSKSDFGTRVDEFLQRADWSGLAGARMTLAGQRQIIPRDELQRVEQRFNESLATHPWIVATAKEKLRARSAPLTKEALRAEVATLAAGLATETEKHRSAVRGFETWIGTVPVAGPLYNIEEGVRHHDASRAAFGLLFLGLDCFDISMSGGGGATRATHPVAVRFRRVALRLDPSLGDIAVHPDIVHAAADDVRIGKRDSNVPSPYRTLAERVRAGDKHVRWRDYDLVHLDNEDRVVPVAHANSGDYYFEVDWRSGRRLRSASPIERDPLTGSFHTSDSVSPPAVADSRDVRGMDVESRFTVAEVKRLLARANDTSLRDIDTILASTFDLTKAGGAASAFDASAFFKKLYRNSHTFRRVVNQFDDVEGRAINSTANGQRKWELHVGETGPLGSPRIAYTDFDFKRIYIPRDADLDAMTYMTAQGQHAYMSEQVYLHEMIHALTGARDPARNLDMLNRGPVVYLTDKILSEGGYRLPEQVMYRRTDVGTDTPEYETIAYRREEAARVAQAENRYLDRLVDIRRGDIADTTLIENTPVASRVTVRDAKDIVIDAQSIEDDVFLSWRDFETKFNDNFGFFVGEGGLTELVAADAKVVANFYRRLYAKSPIFRRLFDQMPAGEPAWRFVLDKSPPAGVVPQGAGLHGTRADAREIYLLDEGTRYLTEYGLRDIEYERNLTYEMVRATKHFDTLDAQDVYANRGAAVYLTDAILVEAGFHYPKQLAAALAPSTDVGAQAQLLSYQTAAQRSAAVEDRYLGYLGYLM